MNADERADRLIADLDSALQAAVGLRRAADVADWLAQGSKPSYLIQPRLLMARHFDIAPAALIYDGKLGTLGIVELVLPSTTENVAAQVRRHLDAATYARHLLLRDRARGERPALTVELVLLTANETDAEKTALEEIGSELRTLVRTTESLYHIGVSLLVHAGEQQAFQGKLRRAFPWLLRATQRWFASARSRPQPDPSATETPGRLQRLSLYNYRLPGQREIVLEEARVHLIHGPNGSGKSSLVEALELVASGKIERLEEAGEKNYERVIKSQGQAEGATIELTWNDGQSKKELRRVTPTGLDTPPSKSVHASSFRLDQPLMKRLIGLFPHERASNYLQAFFPEAAASLEAYAAAAKSREEARAALAGVFESLVAAKKALEEHQGWRGGNATPTSEAFPMLLNSWLEMTALVDLAHSERNVQATLGAARAAGWQSAHIKGIDRLRALEAAGLNIAALKQQEQEWAAEVETLQKKLASFRPVTRAEQRREDKPAVVTEAQSQALNAVSRWLFTEGVLQSFGNFGDKLTRVMSEAEPPTYGQMVIGAEDWAHPAIHDLDAMINACEGLATEKPPAPWSGIAPCVEYEAAAKQQQAVLDAGAELSAGFLDKLRADEGATGEYDGSLIAAVNELLALFTPARWGYSDIQLPSQLDGGKLGLGMELGEREQAVRAELYLNTAELNTFTVALFLLCTGRVHKPFGLILFDDPLQNMDELTSTALARGVAKLVRLSADLGWREELLFLFHGYEDLERFQRELPAAIYRLPWLLPSSRPVEIPTIRAEPVSRIELGAQRLDDLFEDAT
jgi:energy-coupling factor transporter ATP-binding protein EcfA2